jgi:hypothetical protein
VHLQHCAYYDVGQPESTRRSPEALSIYIRPFVVFDTQARRGAGAEEI